MPESRENFLVNKGDLEINEPKNFYLNNRKKIIFLFILILVFCGIFFIFWENIHSFFLNIFSGNSINLEKQLKINLNNCLDDSAFEENFQSKSCIAVSERNIAYCRQNNDSYCVFWGTIGKALEEKDVSICEEILDGRKDFCIALFQRDLTICDKIPELVEKKEWCTSMVNYAENAINEESVADSICKDDEKVLEFFCKASLKGSTDSCREPLRSIICYDDYYSSLAAVKKNSSFCDMVETTRKQVDYCKALIYCENLTQPTKEDIEFCNVALEH